MVILEKYYICFILGYFNRIDCFLKKFFVRLLIFLYKNDYFFKYFRNCYVCLLDIYYFVFLDSFYKIDVVLRVIKRFF